MLHIEMGNNEIDLKVNSEENKRLEDEKELLIKEKCVIEEEQ